MKKPQFYLFFITRNHGVISQIQKSAAKLFIPTLPTIGVEELNFSKEKIKGELHQMKPTTEGKRIPSVSEFG